MGLICKSLTLFLLIIPSLIILSGQATVLVLILVSVPPVISFLRERKMSWLSDTYRNLDALDKFLIFMSLLIVSFYLLISFEIDSFVLFIRVLTLILISMLSIDYYLRTCDRDKANSAAKFYLYGIFMAMLVFFIEVVTSGAISEFFISVISPDKNFNWGKQLSMMNRGMCFLSIAIWPALYPLLSDFKKNRLKLITIFTILLFVVFYSNSETAQLSFLGTVLTTFFILKFKNKIYKLFILIFLLFPVVFIIILSFINPQALSEKRFLETSALARVCIWKYTAATSIEKIYGHGFDSSKNIEYNNKNDKAVCVVGNKLNGLGKRNFFYGIQSHPHQNMLQIFFEFGIFGLFLYFFINIRIIYNIMKSRRSAAFQIVTFNTFLSFTLIGLTGYGIWQNWLIAALLFNILIIKIVQLGSADT
jgi:O-antigen ligase